MSVVRLFSASADPIVSQLTIRTPQETSVVVSILYHVFPNNMLPLTIKCADCQTNPAELPTVHDVELRHICDGRQHDKCTADKALPQQRFDVLVHGRLQTRSFHRGVHFDLPPADALPDFTGQPFTEPCAHLQQAVKVQYWTKKPEEYTSQQEVDGHIETKQWEADTWRQADTAETIELAELYNRRQITYNGDGTKPAADNEHAEKPHTVS